MSKFVKQATLESGPCLRLRLELELDWVCPLCSFSSRIPQVLVRHPQTVHVEVGS